MSKLSFTARRGFLPVLRVLICTLLLAAALSGCLYLHHTAFPFLRARLTELSLKPVSWIVKQLSFSLPFILVCVFLAIVYHGTDRHDGVASREKQWIVIFVMVFVYAILLPYVNQLSKDLYEASVASGAEIPKNDAGESWTLMLKSFEWFIRLAIPLPLIAFFYGVRATREKVQPETPEDASDTTCVASEKETIYEAQE